jgi:aspartyl-tRNA synthetase
MFDFRRTHTCGELNFSHVNKMVTLSGWVNKRRDHGGLIFIDIRDKFGITQLIFDPKISKEAHEISNSLRSEYVISIKGKVISRGKDKTNSKMATGEIEIEVSQIEILSTSKTPPFSVSDDAIDINEELRLKYRYLDIRRGDIIKKLEMRHKIALEVRNYLSSLGFLEIETPILSKTTPEGARDYLVPSRIYPGNFYALPQSPQLFKQLLMISGLDKYFQIARCFRDEDLRADRQPEFTQIDIEMSFNTPEELFSVAEKLFVVLFKKCFDQELKTPFMRLSHKEALEHYGCDKPDLRFEMPLIRLDEQIKKSEFSLLKDLLHDGSHGGASHSKTSQSNAIKALCVKKTEMSRKEVEALASFVENFNVKHLISMKKANGVISSSAAKFFSSDLLSEIEKITKMEDGDLLLIAGGAESCVNQGLDQLRRHLAKKLGLIPPNSFKFLWVTDFPMFALDKETKEITSEHHPFTSPNFEDMHLLEKDPLKVRALAYDLVLNGYEIASGSQRIHNGELQEKIFKLIKLSEDAIKQKFGYFIEALKYGTPPHLGMALGLDRISMIFTNTENIRDVVAFPKTQKASDLMTQSPSLPDESQLKELKLKTAHEKINWN